MNRTANLGVPYILRPFSASLILDTEEHRQVPHLIYNTPFTPSKIVKKGIKE
jgi:hypothetical protein